MSHESNGHYIDPFRERRATSADHLEASTSLKDTAVAAFRNGDLVIASEAYWGVVAHMLQAIAERHDLDHRSNQDFKEIVQWLVEKTDDRDLLWLFTLAYRLHRNFYRIVLDEREVQDYASYAIDLADRIREFADA